MRKKVFFKLMVVITGLLLHFNLWAQIPPITVHVETAGTLSSLIEGRKNEITDLTLTGNLDSRDIRFLREMAGSNYMGMEWTNYGKLANLNLAGANIVGYRQTISGKSSYSDDNTCYYHYTKRVTINNTIDYYYYHTENNVISDYMFYLCSKLTSITIPNSVTSIEREAFRDCTGLTNVTIGNSVTSIGNYAFYNCTGLTSITIPNNVTSIGLCAFEDCTGLTSITIPNSVTSIGNYAFDNCTGLTSITIGSGITSINGFNISRYGYAKLMKILVSEQNQNYSSMDGVLFNKDKTKMIWFPKGKSGYYIIPNSVTSIEREAFRDCIGLTSITISENITSIGESAFRGCTGLTNVTIPNSVTSIGDNAFYGCTGLKEIHCKKSTPPSLGLSCLSYVDKKTCKLYVPKGSYTTYWLAWGFDNIVEEDESAINTINNDNISIQPTSNGIAIEAKEQISVSVYNLTGQIVYQSVIDGNMEIPLNNGVYIVRVNNESQKVIVR